MIESGVPKGSVLGPLLFPVYVTVECNIKSNIKFFADDTMLFSIVKDPIISTNDLNHDLSIIQKWNLTPTPLSRQLRFCFPVRNHPPQIYNGMVVAEVTDQNI